MNDKRLRRLYKEEGLQVRKHAGRKRAIGPRAPIALPTGLDQRWSLDVVSDGFSGGRRFRILAVVDDFTRECLALVADTSLSGARVARELDAVIARRRLRDECLNETLFSSLADARELLVAWRDDYNQVRPHSALANQTLEAIDDSHLALAGASQITQSFEPGLSL